MKVAVFTTFDNSLKTWKDAGILERELKLFETLKQSYKVEFIFFTYGNEVDFELINQYESFEVIPIYSLVKYKKNKFLRYLFSFTVPFKIKNKMSEVDIIYQNQLLGSWVSIITKFLIKKPLIIRTGYDMYTFAIKSNKNIIKIYLYKYLRSFAIRNCDLYTVASKSDYSNLKNNYNKYLKKFLIIPNWAENSIYTPLEKRVDKKILSVGRLVTQKNFELLIKEFKNTKDSFEIDIVGTGNQKNYLQNLADEFNVHINFLGAFDNRDLNALYGQYTFYISTSVFEGNPKSILEALAAGCIVLASNISNHSELIINNKNGYLFDLYNPRLMLKIKNLLDNPDSIKKVSKEAKEFVENSFSLNQIASKYFKNFEYLSKA